MKVTCIILAAGSSNRYGESDKRLAKVAGKPLIRHAIDCALASRCAKVCVVIRPGDGELLALLAKLPVQTLCNSQHAMGIGSSIACGVSALAADIDGALIQPADMPWMDPGLLNELIEQFVTSNGRSIVYPTTQEGEQRNPVLWPRFEFHNLQKLGRDIGARGLIAASSADKTAITASNDDIFRDVDTPADLAG